MVRSYAHTALITPIVLIRVDILRSEHPSTAVHSIRYSDRINPEYPVAPGRLGAHRQAEENLQVNIPNLPEPGTQAWEDMVDFMREDLNNNMMHTKIEILARKIVEDRGGNFDEEFENWRKEKDNEIHRTDGKID